MIILKFNGDMDHSSGSGEIPSSCLPVYSLEDSDPKSRSNEAGRLGGDSREPVILIDEIVLRLYSDNPSCVPNELLDIGQHKYVKESDINPMHLEKWTETLSN
jgi:hypothetical protein